VTNDTRKGKLVRPSQRGLIEYQKEVTPEKENPTRLRLAIKVEEKENYAGSD
jgi:hypothetical protein